MFSKQNSFEELEEAIICENLSFAEDGTTKARVQFSADILFLEKRLFSSEIAGLKVPIFLFKPELLGKKKDIEAQLESVREISFAVNEKHLEADDGSAVVKDACTIIPLLNESVGFQCSLYFSNTVCDPPLPLGK